MEDAEMGSPALVVLRCAACGDTFPAEVAEEEAVCPTCGSSDVAEAGEPLL